VLDLSKLCDELPIVFQKAVAACQFTFHQRRPDEDLTGFLQIDACVVHFAPFDQSQPVEDHPLEGHHLAAGFFPVRFRINRTTQLFSQILDPFRLDGRDRSGKKAGGLHLLGRHDPGAAPVEQARAGKEHEPTILAAKIEILLLFAGDMAEVATQERPMERFVGSRGLVFGKALQLCQDDAKFLVNVLPLAHAPRGQKVFSAESAHLAPGRHR